MPIAASARIHPTALIDPQADLADGVQVGPFALIEGPVRVGPDCVIRARATLIGPMTLGRGNDLGIGVVLGERPQHLHFKTQEITRTEIGDYNTFREFVTVHRGTTATGVTIIGNNNYLMANAHIAHDCRVGNHVMMANGALLAGHCEVHDNCFMSGNAAMHQFCRVGRLAFISGNSSVTKDVLPFMMMVERDHVIGVNLVGMRRAGISTPDIMIVRRLHQILYRSSLLQKLAVEQIISEYGEHPLVVEVLQFIRSSKRGFIGNLKIGDQTDSQAA